MVHNGVLIPTEMHDASIVELDAYAEQVKRGNRAFVDAVFALEDRATELGIELPS